MTRISLICLCVLNFYSRSQNADTKAIIVSLLEQHQDCDYRFALLDHIEKHHGKVSYLGKRVDGIMAPGEWVSHKVVHFCDSNKTEVYPVLIKLVEEGKYDWTCNLLLYYITSRPADSLMSYEPDKCQKWRAKRKKTDLKYWHKFSLK